jgi:hypothetical protein
VLDVATLAAALLAEPPVNVLDDTPPILVDVQPGVWLTRVRGFTAAGGSTFSLDNAMGLDEHNTAFRGALTVTREPWAVKLMSTSFGATGSAASTGGTWAGQAVTAGDSTSFDARWLQLEAQWDHKAPRGDGSRRTNDPLDLLFGPHLAVSYLDLEQRLTSASTLNTVSRDGAWWTVMVGGQLTMQADLKRMVGWLHQLKVEVAGSAGATMNGGGAWSVRAGFTLQFTETIGATIGYRLMEFTDLEQGDWTVSPSFPGLYVGVNISF